MYRNVVKVSCYDVTIFEGISTTSPRFWNVREDDPNYTYLDEKQSFYCRRVRLSKDFQLCAFNGFDLKEDGRLDYRTSRVWAEIGRASVGDRSEVSAITNHEIKVRTGTLDLGVPFAFACKRQVQRSIWTFRTHELVRNVGSNRIYYWTSFNRVGEFEFDLEEKCWFANFKDEMFPPVKSEDVVLSGMQDLALPATPRGDGSHVVSFGDVVHLVSDGVNCWIRIGSELVPAEKEIHVEDPSLKLWIRSYEGSDRVVVFHDGKYRVFETNYRPLEPTFGRFWVERAFLFEREAKSSPHKNAASQVRYLEQIRAGLPVKRYKKERFTKRLFNRVFNPSSRFHQIRPSSAA